jgi:hypothetical protein
MGATHTGYLGHWSDDFKQNAATTTQNMCCKFCIDGGTTQLVEGLAVGSTVCKGTDGCALSYCCGQSISGQGVLSTDLLGVTIDAQVKVPGHGKWWLDGKTGADKRY